MQVQRSAREPNYFFNLPTNLTTGALGNLPNGSESRSAPVALVPPSKEDGFLRIGPLTLGLTKMGEGTPVTLIILLYGNTSV